MYYYTNPEGCLKPLFVGNTRQIYDIQLLLIFIIVVRYYPSEYRILWISEETILYNIPEGCITVENNHLA